MRFLIGIIIGAILTLFIATAVDAPTHATLSRVIYHGERIWDALIDNTTDSLFKVDKAIPSGTSVRQPGTALRAPEPVPPAPLAGSTPSVSETAQPAALPAIEAVAGQADELDLAAATSAGQPTVLPQSQPEEQTLASVWTPFHSQMSAEGFATRLSQQLDHNFHVERQGAGAYQVVFAANSSTERDRLLDQIAEITGQ